MKQPQAVCNYAILRFRPYVETEEFVNIGVLVMCPQPCLLNFEAEPTIPDRARALFPKQNEHAFAAAVEAMTLEMKRLKAGAHDPKSVQMAFHETVRIRESVFRFGEVRTILTDEPRQLVDKLFARYVRMEALKQPKASLETA